MRLGRLRIRRIWSSLQVNHGFAWDSLCRAGYFAATGGVPLKKISLQLRSRDIKGPLDLGWVKAVLFLRELAGSWPDATEEGAARVVRNRRKLKNAALRGRKQSYQPPETVYRHYQGTAVTALFQFYVDRFMAYARQKHLTVTSARLHSRGFKFTLEDLTPLVSGSDALYLAYDYFDWEQTSLNFFLGLESAASRQYLSHFRLLSL